jgi:U2 small nuclear ribonucleoprotein A'
VRHIQPNLVDTVPNLQTLVLTNNNIAELTDLDPLRRFGRLTHMSLLENPVLRKEVSRHLTRDGMGLGR